MLDALAISLRLLQYGGAMILCGSPLLFLYALQADVGAPKDGHLWRRRLLIAAVTALLPAAVASVFIQTAIMAGSLSGGFDLQSLQVVLIGMPFGWALLARIGLSVTALCLVLCMAPSRRLWTLLALIGVGVDASFAWTGHGSSGEGVARPLHLLSDILHLIAASVWIGALCALAALLAGKPRPGDAAHMARVLQRFSGVGACAVAVLILTGLVNSWVLVGVDHIDGLLKTPYGLLLTAKLAIFAAMLAFAALNRFRFTPGLTSASDARQISLALTRLKQSIGLETAAAMIVLVLVSIIGMLAPISSL
jgi:putative copper resistance protein D